MIIMILNGITSLFNKLSVFHIRRTDRFTCPAAKAVIHLFLKSVIRLHQPINSRFHKRNTSAR